MGSTQAKFKNTLQILFAVKNSCYFLPPIAGKQ